MNPIVALVCAAALVAAPAYGQEAPASEEPAPTRLMRMGTGAVTGVYYPVGVALCRLVNETRDEHGLRCAARPSGGSAANIAALREGEIDVAIVQSDVQDAARRGGGRFAEAGPMEDLRAVMSLHPEPLTLVAGAESGIRTVRDLLGKRIAVSAGAGGQANVLTELGNRLGWTDASFAARVELPPNAHSSALCADEIDAFIVAIGHPALIVQEATLGCDATLGAIEGGAVDAMVAVNPFYAESVIPGGLYAGNPDDTPTFGVRATLVARADVPDRDIRILVEAVFGRIAMLRGLHPALQDLTPAEMAGAGLTAPLHPGAQAYYGERDLGE